MLIFAHQLTAQTTECRRVAKQNRRKSGSSGTSMLEDFFLFRTLSRRTSGQGAIVFYPAWCTSGNMGGVNPSVQNGGGYGTLPRNP